MVLQSFALLLSLLLPQTSPTEEFFALHFIADRYHAVKKNEAKYRARRGIPAFSAF